MRMQCKTRVDMQENVAKRMEQMKHAGEEKVKAMWVCVQWVEQTHVTNDESWND